MRGRNCHALRTTIASAWAVAFFLTIGLGGAVAGTRLIAHFENDNNADTWGRDVVRDFYHSQGATADTNLYPNVLGTNNLLPFVGAYYAGPPQKFGDLGSGSPFEIIRYDSLGANKDPRNVVVFENRFAAFGSGWSLGAQDLPQDQPGDPLVDFQINFISVANEDDDVNYRPGPLGLGNFLANNTVTGIVQDWSSYGALCFYLCINASVIPPQQFFDDFKIQLWEYAVDVQGPPWVVNRNEREIYEVSLSEILSQNTGPDGQPLRPFTGWKHLRVPFSSFQRVAWSDTYWRYANFVYGAPPPPDNAYDAMNGTPDLDSIRAIIFRKQPTGIAGEPPDRITVAIDEITVTGDTTAEVLRVNIPGQVEPISAGSPNAGQTRCDDTQDRGLCWAQLFQDDADQVRPYRTPVRPPTGANRNVDVVVSVRDWQQLWATFSAEVGPQGGGGAVVSDDPNSFSSEIVFVPQFQAPGTWVERWRLLPPDALFLRRKGTIQLPGPSGTRHFLFYTDWRYDYTNGVAAENYLVRYNPVGADAFARLNPSVQPRGGFLANYLRDPQLRYAYGTLFILPRDNQGNIGRAWTIDVLFEQSAGELGYERQITGRP